MLAEPLLTDLPHLRGVRSAASPRERARRAVDGARVLHADLMASRPVRYAESFDLVRVPYPTRFALREACAVPMPMLHIVNRMVIVQVDTSDGLKTVLVSPTDVDGSRRTPYFHRLARSFGPLEGLLTPIVGPVLGKVEDILARAGIRAERVDFITYDHLHTQDLRRWIGPSGLFPNARLLVMRQEWDSAHALLPPQADWYCPNGLDGIDPSRVVLLDGDVLLGDGFALIATPGHTEGNHSIVIRTADGVVVTSENGVSADSYQPRRSRIPGVARHARDTGMEVVLNGNTLERSLDQYVSMLVEREIAGRSARHPDFYNVIPSSELTAYWLFPGIRPTVHFGTWRHGAPA